MGAGGLYAPSPRRTSCVLRARNHGPFGKNEDGIGAVGQCRRLAAPAAAGADGEFAEAGARRREKPVAYGSVLDGELVFVPGEIPRRGVFAHWGKGSGSAKLELVFPGGRYGIRKRLVSAGRLQLRLGRDLHWYPYARSDDGWEPSGTAEADPARALTDL
jgi:hypothetical protein